MQTVPHQSAVLSEILLSNRQPAHLISPLPLHLQGSFHQSVAELQRAVIRSFSSQSSFQVWFAFSGNGSQWVKMGLSLLNGSATFRASVHACAAVVRPFGIDLLAEFHSEEGWKSSLMASLGLIAVQIGLVDLLEAQYKIYPAGMLGHSAGTIAQPVFPPI
jgi:fatty acid synthase